MSVQVTQILSMKYGIIANPAAKVECPFCRHKTFSIKHDDTLGKCFHPSCGKCITSWQGSESDHELFHLHQTMYDQFHQALLTLADQKGTNAYQYMTNDRRIHQQVIQDAMIGVVPKDSNVDAPFDPALESAKDNNERVKQVEEARDKLRRCVDGRAGWIAFFYTDQWHRIVAIRFRQPYSKNIVYYKPSANAGLFGRELFSADRHQELAEKLIVTEGEFNQLQLQSLLVRYAESTGKEWGYVEACAVGGVQNADIECVKAVARHPIICYDNDASGAGLELVKRVQKVMTVEAFTTQGVDTDLDDHIKPFGNDYRKAWESVRQLIAGRKQYPREHASVAEEIFHCRQKQGRIDMRKEFEINNAVAKMVKEALLDRGRFYHDAINAYYFDETEKKLLLLDPGNQGCEALLHEYGINSTEAIYRYVVQELRLTAHDQGQATTVHRSSFYDPKQKVLHLYNFSNGIYQIRSDSIKQVDNGTDGVLFLANPTAQPFEIAPQRPATGRSLLHEIILSKINFVPDALTPDERRLFLAYWLWSLFFKELLIHKPILALIGPMGSGKTITLRRLGAMLFGGNFDVMPMPHKADDFDAAITNSDLVCVDNADSRSDWLEDRLATVATGGTLKRRKLYTTNQMMEIPICCNLAITSRTPKFRRDDVADRLLLMPVARFDQFESPESLLRAVLENRNDLMTELAYNLQDVIKALEGFQDAKITTPYRMADFAGFCLKVARYLKCEEKVADILSRLPAEQSAFTLEGESWIDLLEAWVRDNAGKEVTAAELCEELATLADRRGERFFWKGNARGFAQKLPHLLPNLEHLFDIEEVPKRSRQRAYVFRPKSNGGDE